MKPKLTPEQKEEIYNFVMLEWDMSGDAGGKLMRWLDANTAEDEDLAYAHSVDCPLCRQAMLYTPAQIAIRKWKEYQEWLAEWDGDNPAPQEWMTFEDWLKEGEE